MGKFSFLKQKKFYLHLLLIIFLSVLLLWLTIKMLNVYTRHGSEYEMPDFTGMTIEEVEKAYGEDYFFILNDSIYSKTDKPGTIVQQDPLPKAKVKHGRNVYYTIVAKTPEKTKMPNLNNLSLRQAIVLLESSGLLVDELRYVDHFARNAICEQRYKNAVIKPGTELIKGSKITLYVGLGPDDKKATLPSLYGLAPDEVKRTLNLAGLNLGNETYDDVDSIQYMRVYKMDPPFSKGSVKPGTFVNVWYHSTKKFDFDKDLKKTLLEDSIRNAEKQQAILDSIAAAQQDLEPTDIVEDEEENYEDDF